QALVADPHNTTAHSGLVLLYRGARKIDLWLRHVEALARLWSENTGIPPEEREAATEEAAALRKALARIDDELAQLPAGADKRIQRAQFALSRGCVLEALRELDAAASQMTENPSAEQLRIRLMLEAGRVEEAHSAGEILSQTSRETGMTDWPETVAL